MIPEEALNELVLLHGDCAVQVRATGHLCDNPEHHWTRYTVADLVRDYREHVAAQARSHKEIRSLRRAVEVLHG